jgi:hypothetical protein
MREEDIFRKVEDRLDSLYLDLRKPDSGKESDLIFHYTDAAGLLGIVTSGKLWLSNADFLNDASEPRHALNTLQTACDEFLQSDCRTTTSRRALSGFWGWAMEEYGVHGPHVYVFCLSAHDDLLSQWRSYGGRGAGFAIGFSRSKLCDLLFRDRGQYLLRVRYRSDEQSQEVGAVLRNILAIADDADRLRASDQSTFETVGQRLQNKIQSSLLAEVIRLRAKFKNPAFSEEAEWRVIQFVHPNVETPRVLFRSGSGMIRPYVELDVDRRQLPIEQVTIGPTLNPEVSKKGLAMLFAKHFYSNVRIAVSNVPFRI